MAVYTVLEADFISALVAPYGVGPVNDFQGIGDGVENTNYFVTTDISQLSSENSTATERQFVLTVFEELKHSDVQFYLDWLHALDQAGVPVAAALVDNLGNNLQQVEGKPAALFPRLQGRHLDTPTLAQAHSAGQAMAKMHLVSLDHHSLHHDSPKDFTWVEHNIEQLLNFLSADEAELLQAAWQRCNATLRQYQLPSGIIHTDLFRDNALFVDERLSGILDFYSAGSGRLSYDLAVMANDWVSDADGQLNDVLLTAMLNGYDEVRPRSADEQHCWPALLQAAAVRFWVSRLVAIHLPSIDHRPGALIQSKDPELYKRILQYRLQL
ncbi:homoserine kinase [Sinobacterium caligoides]|uniref:Homoserine kinase n=1 Tax=Sinobacterium caligoides TaxID=933926 RepID=A0A3N2DGP7_9GAMM|nr:homoserine kinase [Sinobacterium caligoides]ROR98967.1 homoserine kinase [Sinobacterium caligoides]